MQNGERVDHYITGGSALYEQSRHDAVAIHACPRRCWCRLPAFARSLLRG
ncbi:MAG: hypothetical protein V4633_19345 [Pseudomonadota bacterium]